MVERQISCFDLRQIAVSGQCFRMNLMETNEDPEWTCYSVTAGDHYVEIRQQGDWFLFDCEEDCFDSVWYSYFDLGTDYHAFRERISSRDTYLTAAAEYGSGIRILKQDLWEVMVTFLISQNNNMKRIRQCVERLCFHFGRCLKTLSGTVYYGFPGPEALADLGALKEMGLGYRDKYIAALAAEVAEGVIDLSRFQNMKSPKKIHEELVQIYGIGDKVADCIQLFGLHQIDAFPVDTWMKKILARYYPDGFPLKRYRGCAGVMQQYMFFYESSGRGKRGQDK